MPPALCPLCREPQPIQHGLFLCQKVLRFSRSIKRSIPHPLSLYQPFADGSINPYPLKHTTFLAFFVDLPGGQRNTASSHKESMRRTPPPMHPNTSGLQSGLQKQKRRQFSTNQRRFSWWTDCNARRTLFFMFRHIRFCSAFHLHERFYDRVYFFFIPLCQLYEIKPSFCKRPTTMPSSISHLLAK